MKILVDNSNLYAGGGVQVATSFLNDLCSLEINYEMYVVQSYNSSKSIDKSKFGANFIFIDLDIKSQESIRNRIKSIKKIESEVCPDIIFTVFGPSYHKSKVPKVVGFAVGHIIYNTSYFYSKLNFISLCKIRLSNAIKDYFFRKNSDVLIFETDDARQIYAARIRNSIPTYTISNTLNSIFLDKKKWKSIEIVKSDFRILYLTANYGHKNIEIIPKIVESLLARNIELDFKFYISVTKEELSFDDKFDKYIEYIGKIEIQEIPSLYEQMDVLIMPTLLELFSASYVEAMYMGVPIVASNLSFARDICQDAALYAEPLDADDYCKQLLKIYEDSDVRDSLICNGKENLRRFGSSMDRTLKYLEILKKHAI